MLDDAASQIRVELCGRCNSGSDRKAHHYSDMTRCSARRYDECSVPEPGCSEKPKGLRVEGRFAFKLSLSRANEKMLFSVPARDVRIKSTDGKILSGVIGPYDEGSHLVLVCEATDGKLQSCGRRGDMHLRSNGFYLGRTRYNFRTFVSNHCS